MSYFGDKNAKLVHGMVSGQGQLEGVRFGHCWVEKGNRCIDKSNGNNIDFPKKLYYSLLQAPVPGTKLYKYTSEEVSLNDQIQKHLL